MSHDESGNPPDSPNPPGPSVAGDSQLQSFTLESLASAVNYHRWLTDLVRPYLGEDAIEVGSGLGDYAQTWLDTGLERLTVSDADQSRGSLLRSRFDGDARVTVRDLDVFHPYQGEHSAMVALNVLEHIEDDAGALRAAHQLVRPGGAVVMFVPAFNGAMSQFDRAVGHYRRYRKATLCSAYERAGLTMERVQYVNMPGLLAWFVGMRLLRMTPQDGPTVRLWDNLVVPVARTVESRVSAPFGQSLLAVGRVTR